MANTREPLSAEAEPAVLTPAAERLLAAATDLFATRGIRAVGVDLIAESAGTTKKTLYDRFGSKDALVALHLRRHAQRWQDFLLGYLDEHAAEPGSARVLAVFDALEEWHGDRVRGCAFINGYAEIGGTDHPGVAVIRAEKAWMRRLFERLTGDAVDHDDGSRDRALRIGAQLHLLYEGAIVAKTAGGLTDAVFSARVAAADLLGSAVPAAAGDLVQHDPGRHTRVE